MNTPQTPDYGEPWTLTTDFAFDITVKGSLQGSFNTMELANRAIACVGACAGMADPAKGIEAMREALQEAHTTLESIAKAKPSEWGEMSDQFKPWAQNRARHALAKLQPFIKP